MGKTMKIIKLPSHLYYRHIALWICLLIYINFANYESGASLSLYIYTILSIVNFIVAYYVLLLVIFPSFFETNKLVFLAGLITCISAYIFFGYLNFNVILPFFAEHGAETSRSVLEISKGSLLTFSFATFFSFGAYLNWRSIERAKDAAAKEKNVISRELNFLKDQFHSHLTFNFLNFCYGKMLRSAPKEAESIEDFSEMLRYSLSNKPNEKVPLQKEIDYIEHFIAIQKCLSTSVYVEFKTGGETEKTTILPMILTVFVENAFKHGVFENPESPINISLLVNDNELLFNVKNNKSNKISLHTTGLGLTNSKHFLNIFYPEMHILNVKETETDYSVELILKME